MCRCKEGEKAKFVRMRMRVKHVMCCVYLTLSVSLTLKGGPGANSIHESDHWKSESLSHLTDTERERGRDE